MTGIPWESVTPGYWWAIRKDDENAAEVVILVTPPREIPLYGGRAFISGRDIWEMGTECVDGPEEFIFLAPVAPRA